MKAITISIFSILMVFFVSCRPTLDSDTASQIPGDITVFQQSMLDEINLARTDPVGYAEQRLENARKDSVDNGSYSYMKNLSPLSPLSFNNSLNLSASNYALFLAEKNLMGHDLNGTPMKRAINVGFTGSSIGENIAASTGDSYNSGADPKTAAIYFVRIMIIDSGVTDLGHRLTMMNTKYSTIGIGYSRNTASTFVNYNVQDFGNL